MQPILEALDVAAAAYASVAGAQTTFLTPEEHAEGLRKAHALAAAAHELELRLLASADDLAYRAGARDISQWAHSELNETTHTARADLRLARSLEDHPLVALALREGRLVVEQARAIVRALDDLPARLGEEVREQAERHLVAEAAHFDALALRRMGRHLLEVVAPEIAEAEEARRLRALDRDAAEKVRLTLTPQGDGTTRISGLLTDLTATRLATYLNAWTNPRKADSADASDTSDASAAPDGADLFDGSAVARLPYARRCAEAFERLLEALDPQRLPLHGGDATTVVVTIDWESLRDSVGAADVLDSLPGARVDGAATGRVSVGQVRRLACTAKILPAVLGGRSEVLDLGRSRRLFSAAQRRALLLRDRTCRAEGCDIPGTWAEAHHWVPWSVGGATDLADGVLLCAHHHHRAHDPEVTADRLPSGDVRFHLRQ